MARLNPYERIERLLRGAAKLDTDHLEVLHARLWDLVIQRQFIAGDSIQQVAVAQPRRDETVRVENALRRAFSMVKKGIC